jgi:hypothetical protein
VPLHESTRTRRDRWPLEFDLEGVPRETAERERLLAQKQALEAVPPHQEESMNRPSPNQFAADYQTGDTVVDINNPRVPRYGSPDNPRKEYDKMLYHHESGHVLIVKNAVEEKAARAKGYQAEPAPNRDYSKVKHGRAAVLDTTPNPSVPEMEMPSLSEEEMSAAEQELADYQSAPQQEAAAEPDAPDSEQKQPRRKR